MSDRGGLPLEGVGLLSLEQFGAGPWPTLQLAGLGADVIEDGDLQDVQPAAGLLRAGGLRHDQAARGPGRLRPPCAGAGRVELRTLVDQGTVGTPERAAERVW